MSKKIFMIAGEASGDLHGARIIETLRRKAGPSGLIVHGVGGERIRATGALDFYDLASFHVTGFLEAVTSLPRYLAAERTIVSSVERARPDAVVLIDNPGFNLRLAKRFKAMGLKVFYFIAPQVWAWGEDRVARIRRDIHKVYVVFEFEKRFYEERGVPVEWVGHPLRDIVDLDPLSAAERDTTVVLMPGSRAGEVTRLTGPLLGAADRIAAQQPGLRFQLLCAPTVDPSFFSDRLAACRARIELVREGGYEAIRRCRLVLACSGTATLECALLGAPSIIVYRTSRISYEIGRRVVRVPYLGLPNLILGREAFPELIQHEVTAEAIAERALGILSDPARHEAMVADTAEVARRVGDRGAVERVAANLARELGL
ncbi:MAG: Lipid-A-disaccharide synthase [Candidatus Omnitrophica bacterium]|nr:Lipid-A-disaccharide synthase [Candidatus Omnitrophota bacterium]